MRTIIPDLEILRSVFSYDAATGDLLWAEDRPPMKAGDIAGSRHGRNGDWYVMLKGHRYAASHLAWFLQRGIWPKHRIKFRDGNHDNLAFANLASESETFSENPQAVAYRKRQEVRDLARRRMGREEAMQMGWRDDIKYREQEGVWAVMTQSNSGVMVVVATVKTLPEAEVIANDRQHIAGFLLNHNYVPQALDYTLTAGPDPKTVTYAELSKVMAYDPKLGRFYYRNDPVNPVANFTNTSGRSVVTFWGRYFSVGMLAWFFTHRRWPRPKTIGFRDGNQSNARLNNLYEKK